MCISVNSEHELRAEIILSLWCRSSNVLTSLIALHDKVSEVCLYYCCWQECPCLYLKWTQVTLQIRGVTFGHLLFELLFLQEYSEKVLQFNGMSALITLPKTGFYLGDSLVVSGRVENPSNTSKKVKVGLRVVRVSLFFREFYPLATVWDLELIWLWIDFAPTMQSLPRLHMTLYLWSGKGKVPMLLLRLLLNTENMGIIDGA